jgi:hypothetical protein
MRQRKQPMSWAIFIKVAGTHCATCFKLLNHKDHKAFGNQCSDCDSAAKMERIGHAVAAGFGFLARWTFFVASELAAWAYCAAGDWSAFNTRFADLTVSRVLETAARPAVVVLLSGGLYWWFIGPPESYRLGISIIVRVFCGPKLAPTFKSLHHRLTVACKIPTPTSGSTAIAKNSVRNPK